MYALLKTDPVKIKKYREQKRLEVNARNLKIRENHEAFEKFKKRRNYLWKIRIDKLKKNNPIKYQNFIDKKRKNRKILELKKISNPELFPPQISSADRRKRDRDKYKIQKENRDPVYLRRLQRNRNRAIVQKKLKLKTKMNAEEKKEFGKKLTIRIQNKNLKEEKEKFNFLKNIIKEEYGDDIQFDSSEDILAELKQLDLLKKAGRHSNPA